ncbi:hypothetical protein Cch01nite_10590 [Cellulomonas chitinilytica]|uniref:Uncharacterized protein n=1 Tax=Cellulomonas chitinilytica TaxID=398759 RepID=A0A919P0C4_9CELL|nr:hypothetical protein [Cellulomonas chitinilytica]GIG20335.1 hypothetical protein Cch01nite_10590 [Cellulomonas chitinilytica]
MLWFSVWTVLVVGTLTGAFFLGRRLWRSATALAAELGRAAGAAQELADRVEELRLAAEVRDTGPTVLADVVTVRRRYDAVRAAAHARRAERAERHGRTWASWGAYWR